MNQLQSRRQGFAENAAFVRFAQFDDFADHLQPAFGGLGRAEPLDDPLAQDGELEPVGVDGRPATIVPIRYD